MCSHHIHLGGKGEICWKWKAWPNSDGRNWQLADRKLVLASRYSPDDLDVGTKDVTNKDELRMQGPKLGSVLFEQTNTWYLATMQLFRV